MLELRFYRREGFAGRKRFLCCLSGFVAADEVIDDEGETNEQHGDDGDCDDGAGRQSFLGRLNKHVTFAEDCVGDESELGPGWSCCGLIGEGWT